MTEASLTLVLHPEDALRKLGSCGKPTLISECRVIVNNPSREVPPSETVAPGEIGQLVVRGPQAMEGYWNNPFETQKKLKALTQAIPPANADAITQAVSAMKAWHKSGPAAEKQAVLVRHTSFQQYIKELEATAAARTAKSDNQ